MPRRFTHQYQVWLIDVEHPPRLPWFLRPFIAFHAADHLGSPDSSIRHNVDRFLAANGVDLRGGRVLMLAQARALGHVFDPISVFWCIAADGELACVILEVRNTFGDRHCYLVRPDPAGRAETPKRLYVSPFFGVDGRYLVRLRVSERRLSIAIRLRRSPATDAAPGSERTALVVSLQGRRVAHAWPAIVASVVRHPFPTHRVTASIHYEAWQLRRSGLPGRRRRYHAPQPGLEPDSRSGAGSRARACDRDRDGGQ